MEALSKRLKMAMAVRNMKQVDLCSATGIPKSAMSQYLSGAFEPKQGRVWKMASALNVDEAWLLGYDVPMEKVKDPVTLPSTMYPYTPKGQIPLLGRVAAGLPMYAEENIECYITSDFSDGETYFGLRVQGDSMTAAGIDDGDVVIVRQQDSVDPDQIAVVLVNGDDATIKYIQQQGNIVILSPKSYNPAHKTQIYELDKTPVRIIGRVVQCRKSM